MPREFTGGRLAGAGCGEGRWWAVKAGARLPLSLKSPHGPGQATPGPEARCHL